MSTIQVLSFEEFRSFLANVLEVSEPALTPDAHFLNDLAVDSLRLVELMLRFESLIGKKISIDAAWEILTVGDAYNYYATQVRSL